MEELVDELADRGCVRRVVHPSKGPGRPRSPKLVLHPSLRADIAEIAETSAQGAEKGHSRNFRNTDAEGGPPPDLHAPDRLSDEEREYLKAERAGMAEPLAPELFVGTET